MRVPETSQVSTRPDHKPSKGEASGAVSVVQESRPPCRRLQHAPFAPGVLPLSHLLRESPARDERRGDFLPRPARPGRAMYETPGIDLPWVGSGLGVPFSPAAGRLLLFPSSPHGSSAASSVSKERTSASPSLSTPPTRDCAVSAKGAGGPGKSGAGHCWRHGRGSLLPAS